MAILPHGLGKQIRVLVFASGEAVDIARQAGADYVGEDELIDVILKMLFSVSGSREIVLPLGWFGDRLRALGTNEFKFSDYIGHNDAFFAVGGPIVRGARR